MKTSDPNSPPRRLVRIETRLNNFMRWSGFDPSQFVADADMPTHISIEDGAVHVSSPRVTIGELNLAVLKSNLRGNVPVYLNGIYLATLNTRRTDNE